MKISIRWVVMLGCLGLIWGTHLLVMPLSYFSTKKVMLNHTRDIMENILDLTMEETGNFFSMAGGAANLTKRLISSEVIRAEQGGAQTLERYFFEQLEIYSQFSGIYFARPDGSFYFVSREGIDFRTKLIEMDETGRKTRFIWRDRFRKVLREEDDPSDTYDPRQRPWYIKALSEKGIIWTAPYVFFTSRKPGITTAGPVYDRKGKLVGVVGVDIELDLLSRFLGKLRVGKTGIAFMINQDRDVIAFPDLKQLQYRTGNEKVRLPKISELENQTCLKAFESVQGKIGPGHKKQSPVFASFESNGETFYTMFTRVDADKVSWMIGVYIPEADYLSGIKANQRLTLLLTLGASVLATLFGLFLAGLVIRPISQLDDQAGQIKADDYTRLPRIKTSFRQIQRTADTFYDMRQSIMAYRQELEKREKIHRAITDTAHEAIVMVERPGTIFYWNEAAHSLFGYSVGEVQGKNILELVPFQPHSNEDPLSLNALFSSGNLSRKNVELTIIRRDGRSIPSELSMVSITLEGQAYIIFVIRDVSLRRELEREKMDILGQLKQAQKMEAIGTLAGGITHDFNNLLSIMVGNTELLKSSCSLDDQCKGFVEAISTAGDRAGKLVRQILTFSFQAPHELTPLRIQDILLEACDLMASSLPPSVAITRHIDPTCGMILGDATQIHQVALNLMTNAFQALGKAGGTIGVSLCEKEIPKEKSLQDLGLKPGIYLYYSVSDTGKGIDPHVMDKIFDPYFTTKSGEKGAGLGLAVIKGIVESHGGAIQVESCPGKGTSFHVVLPVIKTRPDPAPQHGPVRIQGGSEHILLVDDQPGVRFVERQILELLGYEVTARASGREALETFGKNPDRFDMVITDYAMPGMTGDVLALELKQIRPGIPVVLCTGYDETVTQGSESRPIIEKYLMKPLKVKEVAVILRSIFDD